MRWSKKSIERREMEENPKKRCSIEEREEERCQTIQYCV